MELIFDGKTKAVYALSDGNYLLKFKDDVTGSDGVFDPGANQVGLTIQGVGRDNLRLSEYFFKKVEAAGIPTHFVGYDVENVTMTVKKATAFGGGLGKGLEAICRYRAVGSFIKRYGDYIKDGGQLDGLVEFTIKNDDKNDPLITQDALEVLGILKPGEFDTLKSLTRRISDIVKSELAAKGVELYDIKLEYGKLDDGTIVLMDEISGGSMRCYLGGKKVEPLDLAKFL